MSAWEDATKDQFSKMWKNIEDKMMERPLTYPPKITYETIEYTKYRCTTAHTRTGQDIHGRIEFKVGEEVSIQTRWLGTEGQVIDLCYFEKIGEHTETKKHVEY